MIPIAIDPEFRALIPALSAEERTQLEMNLLRDGCRDPLVVWNGLLLDGHHRFEICTQAHLPYRIVQQSCADREDAKIWILRQQLGRRNLEPFQLAEVVFVLEPLLSAQAKARQQSGLKQGTELPAELPAEVPFRSFERNGQETVQELAKIAGISRMAMQRALVVKKRGSPALQAQVRSGQVSLSRASAEIWAGRSEAIVAPGLRRESRTVDQPSTHQKRIIRKESDLSAQLQQLLREFRQKRKANNEDMRTRKWIPHGISVLRQKEIMDWMDVALDHLVRQLQAPMPSASGAPATKPRHTTSMGEEDHGNQETPRTTH